MKFDLVPPAADAFVAADAFFAALALYFAAVPLALDFLGRLCIAHVRFAGLGEILSHRLGVVLLPAGHLVVCLSGTLVCSSVSSVPPSTYSSNSGMTESSCSSAKICCTPRLDDTLSCHELDVAADYVAVSGGDLSTQLVRHDRLCAGHFRARDIVEPGVIDLLRRGRNDSGKREVVWDFHVLHLEVRRKVPPSSAVRQITDRPNTRPRLASAAYVDQWR